jgi:hypothetical protein
MGMNEKVKKYLEEKWGKMIAPWTFKGRLDNVKVPVKSKFKDLEEWPQVACATCVFWVPCSKEGDKGECRASTPKTSEQIFAIVPPHCFCKYHQDRNSSKQDRHFLDRG